MAQYIYLHDVLHLLKTMKLKRAVGTDVASEGVNIAVDANNKMIDEIINGLNSGKLISETISVSIETSEPKEARRQLVWEICILIAGVAIGIIFASTIK